MTKAYAKKIVPLNMVDDLMSYLNQIVQVVVIKMVDVDVVEEDPTSANVLKRIEIKMEILSSRNMKNQRKW